MTKSSLVNSLVFVLVLQSSITMFASENNDACKRSCFNKKNAAIAAVTFVAGYEVFKVYQAFAKPELLKPVTETSNYFKTFGKEMLELNKKDFATISCKIKNFGVAVKNTLQVRTANVTDNASYYGNKTLGYIKTPFIYMNARRLEFMKNLQVRKTSAQFNELASGTSKVAELKSNLIELVK